MDRKLRVILFVFVGLLFASTPVLAKSDLAQQKSSAIAAEGVSHAQSPTKVNDVEKKDAEQEEHHGLTHVQVMNFVWHCLNFTLLVLILIKYLKKPIEDAIKGREESIAKAFEELEAKKEEAAKRFNEYEKKLSGMDQEAKQILDNFVAQGEKAKDNIIEQAKAAAERIKAQAEFYVQQELAKAKIELQKEVADMAVSMAEEIIKKNLTEQDHAKLISEYLERVVHKN